MTNHPISTIPFFAAVTLERAGYYGLRAIIVLYLIGETINCTYTEAFAIYGWGVGVMAISNLIGGALGFIGKPKLLSIAGIGLQAIGAFSLAYSETQGMVMIGFSIIGFGSGISRTNLLPFLGQLYQRSKLLDAGLMINYIMVNIGAFISVIIVSLIAESQGFKIAFLLCGVLYIGAALLIYVAKPTESESLEELEKPNKVFPLMVVLAIVGSALFWLGYEFVVGNMYYLTDGLQGDAIIDVLTGTSTNINLIVILVFCVALAIYFTFRKVPTTLQFGIGFVLAALAYLCIAGIDFQNSSTATIKAALFTFFILASLAEVLVGPPIAAYIIRKLNVKYSPMVLAGFYFITSMILKYQISDGLSDFTWNVVIVSVVMLVLAGVFLGFYFNRKNYADHKTEQLDSDFNF
ncbi:MAG: POT family proton-dependent oligopeptide transporter [Crocinitomix sp.]|jgi:POT family proton-dependent oligopeptide transporter